jgi:hypothetical protein
VDGRSGEARGYDALLRERTGNRATDQEATVILPHPYQTRFAEKVGKILLPAKSGEILFDY